MRHRNRIIRTLRKECARLHQQQAEDNKKFQSVLSEVARYHGDANPRAALDYVKYVELKNNHQSDTIICNERDIQMLRMQVSDLQADRVAHTIIIAGLMLLCAGLIFYIWMY